MEGLRKFLFTVDPRAAAAGVLNDLKDLQGGALHFLKEKLGGVDLNFLKEKVGGRILHFMKEKLGAGGRSSDDALHFLFAALVSKVDQIFPPETRSETLTRWAHVALTVALPVSLVALVALFLYYCCGCCRRWCCGRGGYGRMMRAQGRGGSVMPTSVFEASPRDYFLNLRANKPLVF